MSNTFEDLGWPEATLFDMSFTGDVLSFQMQDIVSYGDPLKYEIVKVAISGIQALRIELYPFVDGKYEPKFLPVNIGNVSEDDDVFEGIMHDNPFNEIEAEYFWISGDVKAKTIEIERTGDFVFMPRSK